MKTEIQQAMLALHRMRQQLVKFRTMQINNLRGLLMEYGEIMSKGRNKLNKEIPVVLERIAGRLPAVLIDTFREQWRTGEAGRTGCRDRAPDARVEEGRQGGEGG